MRVQNSEDLYETVKPCEAPVMRYEGVIGPCRTDKIKINVGLEQIDNMTINTEKAIYSC